jgi:hypothetical protein
MDGLTFKYEKDILENVVGFLKSPTVSDPEVLGKHQERYL